MSITRGHRAVDKSSTKSCTTAVQTRCRNFCCSEVAANSPQVIQATQKAVLVSHTRYRAVRPVNQAGHTVGYQGFQVMGNMPPLLTYLAQDVDVDRELDADVREHDREVLQQ